MRAWKNLKGIPDRMNGQEYPFDVQLVESHEPYELARDFFAQTFPRPVPENFTVTGRNNFQYRDGSWHAEWDLPPFATGENATTWVAELPQVQVHPKGAICEGSAPLRYHERFRELYLPEADITACLQRPPLKFDQQVCVSVQPHTYSYCHWIYEALPKIALYQQHFRDGLILHDDKRFAKDFLDVLGVQQRQRIAVTHESPMTQAASVVFASGMTCHEVPKKHIELLRHLLPPENDRRDLGILIDRRPLVRRWKTIKRRYPDVARGLLNHDQLLRALKQRFRELEWRVFTPEMGVREMLSLFKNARIVVGPHGAGFANLLFSPDRTGVVELCPSGSELTFAVLSKLMGHLHRCLAVGDEVSIVAKSQPCEAPIGATLETASQILDEIHS